MAKTKNKKTKIANRGKNAIHDFVITSSDFDGMEMAYDSIESSFKRSCVGTGYCFGDGARDHHFRVKGYARADHILNHYRSLISKRRRGGISVFDNTECAS